MWVLDRRRVPPFRDLDQAGARVGLDVNRCAALADMGSGPLGEVHDEDGIFWALSSMPWGAFNVVGHCQLADDELENRIREKQAYFRSKGRSLVWWSTPYTTPPVLVERLLANGFVHRASFPGMAADLRGLPGPDQLPIPKDARIERVTDEQALRDWVRTCLIGFGESMENLDPAVALFKDLALREGCEWRCYLAMLEGQPASSAAVMMTGGIAGIYWVGTPARYRRLGLGTAVTAAALRDAYGEGYRVGCLTSSQLGWPIYTKLGFTTYAEFHTYRWPE